MKTYLLLSNNLIKIGKTKHHKNRMSSYKTHNPGFKQILILDGNYENELHATFANKLVQGEWFNLDMSDYVKIFTKYQSQIEFETLLSSCTNSYSFEILSQVYQLDALKYSEEDGIVYSTDWDILSYTPSQNGKWHIFLSNSTDTSITNMYVFQ